MTARRTYRRSPRLKGFDYRGPLTAFLTFVTRGRAPIFEDEKLAQIALENLEGACAKFKAVVHAFCFMPDHAHILVSVPEGASLKEFVRAYKQASGFALKQLMGAEAWQVSYYDRVLRREEALEDVASYIWNNPVEAGLVAKATEYAWSGPRELLQ